MDLDDILQKIQKKKKSRNDCSSKQKQKNALREKLVRDFQLSKTRMTKKDFVQQWVQNRKRHMASDEYNYSVDHTLKLLTSFHKGDVVYLKSHNGAQSKLTDQEKLCLLATVMDYPQLTDEERQKFLNNYVIKDASRHVATRTINHYLNTFNFTVKKPCFSVKERNGFGYRIARALWSWRLAEISQQQNVLMMFIDEAGVKKPTPQHSRAFISVTPIIEGKAANHNAATILSAIVPNYGTISK